MWGLTLKVYWKVFYFEQLQKVYILNIYPADHDCHYCRFESVLLVD